MRLIDLDKFPLLPMKLEGDLSEYERGYLDAQSNMNNLEKVVAIPVTHGELRHMINDIIAYTWGLEDRGANKPEFGYDGRKELLEKLKQFERDHFPEMECCDG